MNPRFSLKPSFVLGRTAACVILPALAWIPASGQQADPAADAVVSGPPSGTSLTPVMAYAPVGPRAGEEYDAVADIGEGPGALLFIHELSRNALPVIRAIDQLGAELSLLGLHTETLMLSDDRTATETKLQAVNGSLRLHQPVVLSLDGSDGPGNYALNRKAVLTLIVVDEGKVVRSAGFTDVNQKDADTVREWIVDVTGPLPDDPAELRALAGAALPDDAGELRDLATDQTVEIHQLRAEVARLKQRLAEAAYQARAGGMTGRGESARGGMGRSEAKDPSTTADTPPATAPPGETPQRRGSPPDDPELSALLRTLIRQTNDDAANDAAFAAIQARAAENDDLGRQTIEMFKLMLSFRDRYGTDYAQGLAEAFLDAAEQPADRSPTGDRQEEAE